MTEWKKAILDLSMTRYRNVPNRYHPHHLMLMLLIIGERQPLGRYDITENLTIGEGSVRTLLRRLTEADYLISEPHQGQRLAQKGQELFDAIKRDIPKGLFLKLGDLVVHDYSYANIVRGKASMVTDGILQRDNAMTYGGHGNAGATTLVMEHNMLIMPPDDTNILLKNEQESLLILDVFRPRNNDVIIIGASNERNMAREASMAASMTLF